MTNLAVVSDKVPAYLKGTLEGVGRGNEHIGQEVIIPRIKLIHAVSPEYDKQDPKYIKDIEPGDFLNSLTGDNLGKSIKVLSLLMRPLWWATKDFGTGGGMAPKVDTKEEAEAWKIEQTSPDLWTVSEVHEHVLLLLDEKTGEPERSPALMDFGGAKISTSKAWNSKILQLEGDRFSSVWDLYSQTNISKNTGKPYQSVNVKRIGYATEANYEYAGELYDQYTRNR